MAESLLDMTLDQLIQKNKAFNTSSSATARSTVRGRGAAAGKASRGRGRAAGADSSAPGPTRRAPNRFQPRTTPYFTPQGLNQMQMQEVLIPGGMDADSGTKLYISNLDYGVTNEDIKVLFSEVGELRRYSIHYDKSGRSKGTAEVAFVRQSDAFAAVKRYSGVQLDGKPMKIEMVGVKLVAPTNIAMPPTTNGFPGNTGGAFRRQQRVAGRGRDRGSNGGRGAARGRGRGRGQGEKVSPEDLDADLEKYHQEAMQLN
ncbi:THO complex subunit 4B-like isoform X2 [Apium graveolens]|uniref:THO complex subunit 4B-like isoform X2 n=1 Tax=Apium graveolens TaxID=4045 RepID=UPI003D795A4E